MAEGDEAGACKGTRFGKVTEKIGVEEVWRVRWSRESLRSRVAGEFKNGRLAKKDVK